MPGAVLSRFVRFLGRGTVPIVAAKCLVCPFGPNPAPVLRGDRASKPGPEPTLLPHAVVMGTEVRRLWVPPPPLFVLPRHKLGWQGDAHTRQSP